MHIMLAWVGHGRCIHSLLSGSGPRILSRVMFPRLSLSCTRVGPEDLIRWGLACLNMLWVRFCLPRRGSSLMSTNQNLSSERLVHKDFIQINLWLNPSARVQRVCVFEISSKSNVPKSLRTPYRDHLEVIFSDSLLHSRGIIQASIPPFKDHSTLNAPWMPT